jgi:hypothetical protein
MVGFIRRAEEPEVDYRQAVAVAHKKLAEQEQETGEQ